MSEYHQNKIAIALEHIKFYQLNEKAWCAVATLPDSNENLTKTLSPIQQKKHERQQQRLGTRQLLRLLLNHLDIKDELVETSFPYHLKKMGAFVCFSHSENQVAVAISSQSPIGLDIEAQNISQQVAKRYYHPNEMAQLAKLDDQTQQTVMRLLWQVKESVIKIEQFTLAQGLGKDYSALILPIKNALLSNKQIFTFPIHLSEGHSYHAYFMIGNHLAIVY